MRTSNSLKNIITGFAGQLLVTVLNFAVRTVFISTLSEEYLGINSLLASVLTVLNLTELGLGSSIIYAMYGPMGRGDIRKTQTLLRFYRNAYRVVGCVFFAVGLILVPFLHFLVKGGTDLVNLRLVFVLSLSETASSYLFFAYLGSVTSADQKSYLVAPIHYLVNLGTAVARILALLLLRNNPELSFYSFCLIGVLSKLCYNLLMRRKTYRLYPWAAEKNVEPLPKEEKTAIYKNVVGMTTNKVCQVLNDGIDSTVISALIGAAQTGVFSNYILLRSYVNNFMRTIFGSLHASIGNLCATESREKKEEFFLSLQFTYFWIYGFCAISLWILLDSFIVGVWLHDTKWLLSRWDVFLLSFNFLIEGLAGAAVKYRDVTGMFWQTKWRYIISSVFNAVLSIVLVGPLHMGVTGALLGTTASLTIMISYDPVIVYRDIFHKKAGEFYRMYFGLLALVMATGGLVYVLCIPFSSYTFLNCVLRLAVCLLVPNFLWFLIYRKDRRFAYLKNTAFAVFRKFLRKRAAA